MKMTKAYVMKEWLQLVLPRYKIQIVVVQSLTHVHLFGTPWTAAHQVSLSFTIALSFHLSYIDVYNTDLELLV